MSLENSTGDFMNLKWGTRKIALLCSLSLLAASAYADPVTNQEPIVKSPTSQPSVGSGASDLTSLSLEDLMNVQVTSVSKKKESIAVAPAAVAVINQDDISRSGFSTIPDLLRMAPGVDVGRINSFTWAVGVRGLNDQYNSNLLVLQDGRSVYSSLFAGVYWDTVDYMLPDLDRIEVIRGPGATLWGANAVNGVINITSKDAQETQGLLVDSRASNDESDIGVRYGGKLSDDTYYRAYFKTAYFNELDDTNGDNAGDDWRSLRGGFRIDKHASDADTLTLQGDVGDNLINEPFNQPIPAPPFTEPIKYQREDVTGNLLSRWSHRFSDDSDFALQVYYDYLKVNSASTDYNQNTIDIDFHHRIKLDARNEVTWGLGYRLVNSLIMATPELAGFPPTKNDNVFSAFVQDTMTLQPDHWSFTIGSKFEHNDYNGYDVEPSARLLWTPNKTNSVWGSVSEADRTPSRLNTDTVVQTGFELIPIGPGTSVPAANRLFSNPDQKAEKLTAYELGYRLQPAKNLSFDVAAFYNQYQDKQSIVNGTPIIGAPIVIPLFYGNLASGHTYGGEISATYNVTQDWRLVGSYSLVEAKFSALDTTDADSAPKNMAQIRSNLDVTRHVQFNAAVYYVSSVGEFNVPGYVSTDLNLAWKPTKDLSCSIGVLNLFDNHHPEYGTNSIEGVASEVPRTFYGQLSYAF
jgi:iron complex outermembrane recepter protein